MGISGSVNMEEVVSFNVLVPEFATLAVMVMASSIATVLGLSRRKHY